jgi:hypothetical protein
MHCKNVILGEDFSPSLRQNKSRQSAGKFPLMKSYILHIQPVRKMMKETHGQERLTRESLHICRGHFKNFDDRKLFGKYSGTFWWAQHVRGDEKAGIIKKQYEVHAK